VNQLRLLAATNPPARGLQHEETAAKMSMSSLMES
jgi:hypothetical protein